MAKWEQVHMLLLGSLLMSKKKSVEIAYTHFFGLKSNILCLHSFFIAETECHQFSGLEQNTFIML